MVTSIHRLTRFAAATLVLAFLCQCTTREVKTTRTRISFAGDGDESALRSRFAESGYKIGEDGQIQADNPNLHAGKKPGGLKGEYESKQARLKKGGLATNKYKTPEYIKLQNHKGVKESRDGSLVAREGGSDQSRQAGKLFKSRSRATGDYAEYDTGTYDDSGRLFDTGQNEKLTGAFAKPARAEGRESQIGYRDNAALSMNDVKKMVSPGVYARATGVE